MEREQICDAIRDFLDGQDLRYAYRADTHCLVSGFSLDCKLREVQTVWNILDDAFLLYGLSPVNAGPDSLGEVLKYVSMINYGLIPANFEVDVGDGVSAALSAGVVMDRGRVVASLTPTESNILRELSRRRGAFISVDDLIAALRGSGYSCEDNMLYAHISNLRRKLGAAGGRIGTERGRGYRLSRK